MLIKAGSVTNLTDARFFAAYDVDYMGFCFDPQSPDYISPTQALAISGWISGPKIVAELGNQDAENVKAIIEFFNPDIIQIKESEIHLLNGNDHLPLIVETESIRDTLKPENVLFYLLPFDQINAEFDPPAYYMVDISNAPSFDPLTTKISAIQLKGSPEQEIGLKSFDKIAELLDVMKR